MLIIMYNNAMKKTLIIGALFATTSALAVPAYACDMHGGAYGFGNPNANWKTYNPRVSTEDPALLNQNAEIDTMITPIPPEKKRPSFSNAANRAAVVAKSRMAKKAKNQEEKTSKDNIVKKVALDSDS